jgi:hypothetical protein
MSDFQTEMNRVVSGFVAQITELARRAAIDTLENALGKRTSSDRSRRSGAKRSSNELDRLAHSFQTYVVKHPGMRIEQINKELGTTTKDLALPIRKLISDGAIKTKGEKRSTTYFSSKRN